MCFVLLESPNRLNIYYSDLLKNVNLSQPRPGKLQAKLQLLAIENVIKLVTSTGFRV